MYDARQKAGATKPIEIYVAPQALKPDAARHAQIQQTFCRVQHQQFPPRRLRLRGA
jgi:hypothetical protein